MGAVAAEVIKSGQEGISGTGGMRWRMRRKRGMCVCVCVWRRTGIAVAVL